MGVVMFCTNSFRAKSIQGLAIAAAFAGSLFATTASANPLFLFPPIGQPMQQYEPPAAMAPRGEDEGIADQSRFKRQVVDYRTTESAGTVIIDTPHTYLYYVLGNGKAIRYGIGVGREGFTWSGTQTVTKKAEWPDWTPPA